MHTRLVPDIFATFLIIRFVCVFLLFTFAVRIFMIFLTEKEHIENNWNFVAVWNVRSCFVPLWKFVIGQLYFVRIPFFIFVSRNLVPFGNLMSDDKFWIVNFYVLFYSVFSIGSLFCWLAHTYVRLIIQNILLLITFLLLLLKLLYSWKNVSMNTESLISCFLHIFKQSTESMTFCIKY